LSKLGRKRTHDHAKIDVLALIRDVFPAHELLNLEELSQM
jgi:hypothetical protein